MISSEILKKIRGIDIITRKALRGNLIGDRSSRQKGYGLDFDQIREYQLGDDVRFIDWKSSARMDKILVKQYKQEYSKNIVLLVDVSGSSFFGSKKNIKY